MILIFIGVVVVVLLALGLAIKMKLNLKHLLCEISYQLYYYLLGGTAMFEDYFYRRNNKIEIVSRPEKVAVITGGARGLGVEVVRGLLQCEMNVIIGCRNVEAGEKMIEMIQASGNYNGRASCIHLDLMSLKSVRSFAEVVINKYPRLHYLINNAGIMFVPYQLTEDGYESHFAVNYLSHCLLTHLLLPHLKAGGQEQETNSRIVNVSSCAYMAGSIHFKDFSMKDMYIPSAAYAQSKLAQILFTNHLDRLLKMDEAPVQIHSVHPGIVNTDLFNGTLLKTIAPWAPYIFFKTPPQGAASVLYACLSANLEGRGGTYISNCQVSRTTSKARDQATQECLWSAMLNMINVNKFGLHTRLRIWLSGWFLVNGQGCFSAHVRL